MPSPMPAICTCRAVFAGMARSYKGGTRLHSAIDPLRMVASHLACIEQAQ